MEKIIEKALSKGVEMHVAGSYELARQLYESVIELQPNHADANHNMGLLKLDTCHDLEALPYLQTALQADTSVAQFWLSYIKALIKLDRLDEAARVLDLAKESGIESEDFFKLNQMINDTSQKARIAEIDPVTSRQTEQITLDSQKLDSEVGFKKKDIKITTANGSTRARQDFLAKSSRNKKLQKGRSSFKDPRRSSTDQNAHQDAVTRLFNLYEQRQLSAVIEEAQTLTQQYPDEVLVWNLLGAAAAQIGQLDKAIHAFQRVLSIKPDDADAYNNIGNVLKEQGKPDEAIAAYKKALTIKSDYAQAYNNMGNVLKEQGKPDEAIAAYNKALFIEPNYAQAHYNTGHALQYQGKLDEAVAFYQQALSINPNYAEAFCGMGRALQHQDKLDEAVTAYKQALSINSDCPEVFNNMGVALNDLGNVDEAVEAYNNAISIKPDYADAHNNKGNALKDQGKLDEATEAYNNAISIRPDYADAHNNKGNALKDQGKLDEATEAYNNAISIKPDYAEAYCNMGIALKEQGKLEEAVNAYNKALSLKLDFAEAYNNLGIALQDQEKLEAATEAYNKAVSIRPDYAKALWNLSGTAESVSEAKQSLDKCLTADPNHLIAELTLSALKFYEGDKSDYNTLLKSSLKNHPYMRSFIWTFNLPKLPPLHFHRWALFDHMTALSKKDRPFYEFGVWRGEAFRYLIKTYKRGYGFDTFEGLPEDWHNEKSGTYSSDGNVPRIDGGEFIVGKFEDTLPGFFAKTRPTASIINFDADLYSSTICALNFAKPVIDQDTILIFDEFIINKHWEQDEYKALEEFCADNHFTYEVLAVSFFTKQVAVKIIGI